MNLAWQIKQYLPQGLLELIQSISVQADKLGQKVYLVGGIVRDLLLEGPALRTGLRFDLDLVIEGDAVKLAAAIAETSQAKIVIHPHFGTAKLSSSDFTLDIATARKETYAKPGALPTVTPGTLSDDLYRRDFSINAMAISISQNNYGELFDLYQGKDDLEHHLIRVLHPESFRDDATRILRAIRYEQRLGFKLETQTAMLLKRDIPMLDTISGDRIRHELELILKERYPEYVLKRLDELGILQRITPSLKGNGWLAAKFDKARQLVKPGQLVSLYFCLLIYPLEAEEVEQFIHRLNMPAKLSRALRNALRLKSQISFLNESSLRPSEIYYLLHDYDPLAVQATAIATEPSTIHEHLQLFLTKLRYVKTLLDGEKLKSFGIPEGPELGKILQALHKARLDGEINTRADEERLALSLKQNFSH